jgi:ABC-type branched-subunit amino acid transport system ATPase component
MRLLHYVEIENFKRFGGNQRIELDHPAVLIGPNNCGKTSAIQAIALWSQAVKAWYAVRKASDAKERPATSLNRLSITAVPVQKARYFWHDTRVHTGKAYIPMSVTVGLETQGSLRPLRMRFTWRADEVVYCQPDESALDDRDLIAYAASLNVELLYPMSGLVTEEPILKEGRINVLLGQGETAQVLRNLCLMVSRDDWPKIVDRMARLFSVRLGSPRENERGSVELTYDQPGVKEPLDLAMAGRGFQQLLLIFAYLYSHKKSVLLIDEPDAHLEILRQKQVYVLLRDIAHENEAQVVLVTHSEVILEEALDHHLTLLLDGRVDDLARKTDIRNALKHYGAEHYVRARESGYVLYVEGSTDIDILRRMAERLVHPVAAVWDEQPNVYYVQNNHPDADLDSELERVEGGFGITPQKHFGSLRQLVPGLCGAAVLDNDGRSRRSTTDDDLTITYWQRYEAENYFITPELLRRHAVAAYADLDLFDANRAAVDEVMDDLMLDRVFSGNANDLDVFRASTGDTRRLLWVAKTERLKLSDFAEEFFRRLSTRLGMPMLLRKGELHRLLDDVDPRDLPREVYEKLDVLHALLLRAAERRRAARDEGESGSPG